MPEHLDHEPQAESVIAWNPDHDRWEARTEEGLLVGRLEVVGHDDDPEDLAHTIVEPAFEGRGIAGRLVHAALDDARARGVHVVPSCSYAHAWIEKHPEYRDLVAD